MVKEMNKNTMIKNNMSHKKSLFTKAAFNM